MIKNASTMHADGTVNAIIYGESGVGKTRLALTVDRPLVISAEGGLLSLAGHDVPYLEVSDINSARQAVDYTKKHAAEFGTIIFDSLSEISEIVLADAMTKTPDPRKVYPETEASITRMIRYLRDLPCNVVWIAKQDSGKDNLGGTYYRPMVPGQKFSDKLPYLVDMIGRMSVDSVTKEDGTSTIRRSIRFSGDGSFVAKDRSGKLPELCPAHLGKIFDRIRQPTNGS